MKNYVLAINRSHASGAKDILRILSDKLEIPFYDKENVYLFAEKSGLHLCEKSNTEKPINSLLYTLATADHPVNTISSLLKYQTQDNAIKTQNHVIKKLAQSPCIILGMLADYILKDEPNIIKIYINCNNESAIERLVQEQQISREDAAIVLNKENKRRASTYNYNTGKSITDLRNYDLSIDTSKISESAAADIILNYIDSLSS